MYVIHETIDCSVVQKVFISIFQFEANGKPFDYSLLAFDCFHMSQKGHG